MDPGSAAHHSVLRSVRGTRRPRPQWAERFVSRTRCSVLHAAPQSRDSHFLVEAWAPDQQRTANALRGVRGTKASKPQFAGQIAPVRIELLDQGDLPCTPPSLQGMFPCACFKKGIKRFKMNELINLVFAREAGDKLRLMF